MWTSRALDSSIDVPEGARVTTAPQDAATVIVLRDAAGGVEVLLMARHTASRSFGGAHVFPGGHVDADDAHSDVLRVAGERCDPARAAVADERAPSEALRFWVAAIRELFEEAGLLLADSRTAPLDFGDPVVHERLAAHRRALIAGDLSFAELLHCEHLVLATDALTYFSRWITPVHAPRRYDARFFVARVPAGQTPLHDAQETTAAEWWTPAAALVAAGAGTMTLTPPTARTLEELGELGSCDRILADARHRRVVAILPKVVQLGGQLGVLYPGDVAYDATEPGAVVATDGPGPFNRAIMDDSGWRRLRSVSS